MYTARGRCPLVKSWALVKPWGLASSSWRAAVHPLTSFPLQVDQLLAPHFREDMIRLEQHVGKSIPEGRQTLIVSATLSDKVSTLLSPSSDL